MGRKRSKQKRRRDYSTSSDSSISSSDGSSSNRHKNNKHKKKKHRKSSETKNKKSSRSRSRTHTSSRDRQSSNNLVRTQSLDKALVVDIRESKSSATVTGPDSKEQAIPVKSGGPTATSTPKPSGSRDVVTSRSSKIPIRSSKTRVNEKCNSPYNRTHTSTDNRQSSNSLGKTPDLNRAGPGAIHVQASRLSTTGPDGPDSSAQLIYAISEGLSAGSTPKPSGSRDVAVEESSKTLKKSSKTNIDDKKLSRSSSRTHTATYNGQSSNSSVTSLNIDKPAVIPTQEAKSSATLRESRDQVRVENIPLMFGGYAASGTPEPNGSGDVRAGGSGGGMEQLTSVPATGDHSISTLIVPKPQVTDQQPVEVNKVAMESAGVSGANQPDSKEDASRDEVWKSELQCSICSELFINATMLNCSHTFCEYCIRMWKRNKLQCPLCRTSITSESRVKILDSLVERISQTSEDKKLAREEVLRERQELEANQNRLHPPGAESAGTLTGAPSHSDIDGGSLSPDQQLDYYDFYETDNDNDDGDDDIEADDDYAFYDGSGDQNENDSDHYYTEIDNDEENDDIGSFVDNGNNDDHGDDPNEEAFVYDSDYVNDDSEINYASGDNDGNSIDDNDEVSVSGQEESADGHEESVDGREESVDGREESVDGHDESVDSHEVSDNSNEVSDNVDSDGDVENGNYDDENDGRSGTDNNDDDDGGVAYENSDDNLNDYNSNNESNQDYDHIDANECDYSHGGSGDNDSHYDNVNDDYDDDNDNGYDENNCDSGSFYNSDSS